MSATSCRRTRAEHGGAWRSRAGSASRGADGHRSASRSWRTGCVADEHRRARTVSRRRHAQDAQLDSTHPLRGLSAWTTTRESRCVSPTPGRASWPLRQAGGESWTAATVMRGSGWCCWTDRRVRGGEPAPDFELREPVTAALEVPPLALDLASWRDVVVSASELLDAEDEIYVNQVGRGDAQEDACRHRRRRHRRRTAAPALVAQATAIADDGDEVLLFRRSTSRQRPPPQRGGGHADGPGAGPGHRGLAGCTAGGVLHRPGPLGRAAGVFFHEAAGHRSRPPAEARWRGQDVPRAHRSAGAAGLDDVYDDPNVAQLAGHDLNGHYRFDDEGVEAQGRSSSRTACFVLLMSRSAVGPAHSNGYGRRSPGRAWPSYGNTIIEASKTVSEAQRQGLIAAG